MSNTEGLKECSHCHKWLPLNAFSKDAKAKDGLFGYCKECVALYEVEHYAERKLRSMRERAEKRGHTCTITVQEVKRLLDETTNCPVFGFPLKLNRGCSGFDSASVDRIDISKGYDSGNVQVMSQLANQIKASATSWRQVRMVADYMEQQEKEKECLNSKITRKEKVTDTTGWLDFS